MYPILFEYGPIRIGSYGVLLASAFIAAIIITNREFRKHGADLSLAWDIYLLAIIGGLAGSRLLFALESLERLREAPFETLFGSTGFAVNGGYILAFILCWMRVKAAGESFLRMADLTAPGLAIGYAVGRLGCIAAGDGCYGLPTLSCFAMHFPNGLVPTLSAKNAFLVRLFIERYPGKPVPVDIGVHPAPLYESFSHFVLLFVLLRVSWKIGSGKRLALFLSWFGISRFLIEFIRLNPTFWLGLTNDQWIGLFMASIGMALFMRKETN